MFKNIETERLYLRKLTLNDIDDLFEMTNDPEVAKYVGWNRHENISETKKYVKSVLEQYEGDNPYIWGVELKQNHKLIGTIEITRLKQKHNWCELDADLNRNYWGKGINTETLKAVLGFCFTELNLNRVQTKCYKENIGPAKVFNKVGMTYEGLQREQVLKNGIYHDLLRFSILKREFFNLYK